MAHGTQQALVSVIGKSMSKARDISWNAARRMCFVRKDTESQE